VVALIAISNKGTLDIYLVIAGKLQSVPGSDGQGFIIIDIECPSDDIRDAVVQPDASVDVIRLNPDGIGIVAGDGQANADVLYIVSIGVDGVAAIIPDSAVADARVSGRILAVNTIAAVVLYGTIGDGGKGVAAN